MFVNVTSVTMERMDHVLAQVNIGRLLAPLDSPQIAGFAAALEPVNALADAAPDFIWRLQSEEGDATALWWIPRGHVPDARLGREDRTCPA